MKNYTRIIFVIIAIVVFGGLVWFARPSPSEEGLKTNNLASLSGNSGSILKAEETNFNFGAISMAAGPVRHQFKIKNTGSEQVTIEKMYTSCMCTTAAITLNGKQFGPFGMPGHGFIPKVNETISAGEEASVEVVFDPAAHGPAGIGRIERSITIENNAGRPLEFGLTAIVTP